MLEQLKEERLKLAHDIVDLKNTLQYSLIDPTERILIEQRLAATVALEEALQKSIHFTSLKK